MIGFIVAGHLIYRALARFESFRKVVISWHLALLAGAAFVCVRVGERLADGLLLFAPHQQVQQKLDIGQVLHFASSDTSGLTLRLIMFNRQFG